MNKPMSKLLTAMLTVIILMSSMVVSVFAADAKVTYMKYQPHPNLPGVNGNAIVRVDYGDGVGHGICVEPAKDAPPVGVTLSLESADQTMTRYAYMASQCQDNNYRTWAIHHAASDHMGLDNGTADPLIAQVKREVGSVVVPDSFEAFIGRPSNSAYQVMLLWRTKPTGKLELVKSSTNTSITAGNSCYSLRGAVYGVFNTRSDAVAEQNAVGKFTTDANGKAPALTLKAGTYWYKELQAPKGYAKNTEVKSVTVAAGETAVIHASDHPQSDPVGVLLKKVDSTSGDGETR